MKTVSLKYQGKTIAVPESDAEWFVKSKGAERVGGSSNADNNDAIGGRSKSEWAATKVADIDDAIADINDVKTLNAVLKCVDTKGGKLKIKSKIESINNN